MPASLGRAPAATDEWLLVRLSGSIVKVERLGDRWRAEIVLADGSKVPVHGQPGAGIPSTAIVAGRRITVTGIVRRPYPTASDRRFALLPRDGADIAIGPSDSGAAPDATGGTDQGGALPGAAPPTTNITPDTDLATLLDHVGQRVRVGGLIASIGADGFDLDDGTALARIVLSGDMAALLPHLREGEAIAATGVVALQDGAAVVIVDGTGTLVRVGSLGQAVPIGGFAAEATPAPSADGAVAALAADSSALRPALPPASLLAISMVSALSVLVTLARRRVARRRLRQVLVARLASLRPNIG